MTNDGEAGGPIPGSHALAFSFGVSASQVQLQKASFFAADDTDLDEIVTDSQKSEYTTGNCLHKQYC